MSIPKVIYQMCSSTKLPLYAKWQIWKFKRKHKQYKHILYTNSMVDDFIQNNFNRQVYDLFSKLQPGLAKSNFFRYAILYFNGGIFLDLEASIKTNLDKVIGITDTAIITQEEGHKKLYAQWALIFERQHPILKNTINLLLENITNKSFPYDIASATGSLPYSTAIDQYLNEHPNSPVKVVQNNYKGIFMVKTFFSRLHDFFHKKEDIQHVSVYRK